MPLITNPAAVVRHIIHKEVQHDSDEIAVDEISYIENTEEGGINDDIDLAFTVHDKQINSKKLIEGIASNSRLIPYIKDNTLFFQGINPSPSPELTTTEIEEGDGFGDVDMYIESSDIISYTNKRTAPEKVYTKVIVNYHYDYALKDFTENTLDNSQGSDTATEWFLCNEQGDGLGQYDIANLGLEAEQDLPFDAHYIREKFSAEALQEFLLLWHCNQHNVLKLRLPLKYIQLKIGDYIGFDKLINDVKLFGEDYSISGWYTENTFRNGQQILPVWMITSTNKTLTHIDVEMIQMHNCTPSVTDSDNLPPEIVSVELELVHPTIPENVIGNSIILSGDLSGDVYEGDTWFQVNLTTNATDPNDDDLQYRWDRASFSDLSSLIGLGEWYITDIYGDLAENGLYDSSPYGDENSKTLLLGNYSGEDIWGEWLETWLGAADSGEYLEFSAGVFRAAVTDAEFIIDRVLPSFKIYKDEIPVPDMVVNVEYQSGWNLVGLPLEVASTYYEDLYPTAEAGTLYGFNGTYYQAEELIYGKGYWLLFEEAGSVDIIGQPIYELTLSLTENWNLISGISEAVNVDDIDDPDGIIIPDTLYGFGDTYNSSEVLEPGRAYWIRANADGDITISHNPEL